MLIVERLEMKGGVEGEMEALIERLERKGRDERQRQGRRQGGGGGGGGEDGGKRDGSVPPTSSTGSQTAGNPTKRKQREVGPRDVARCEQIAALLSKGLKGKDLEAAIAEFDAKRAPVVITPRFEVPITALQYEGGGGVSSKMSTTTTTPKQELDTIMDTMQMQGMDDQRPSARKYRRSSSAPLLEAEHSKAAQFMRPASPSPLSSSTSFSATTTTGAATNANYTTTPPRPQSSFASPSSVSASPSTPTQTTPTYRTQRKRSTSSSPPLRQRTLMTQASLQCMNFYQQSPHLQQTPQQPQQPPQLTLNTASLSGYGGVAAGPMSAPVDSASSYMYGQESASAGDVFFDIDSSPVQWYDGASTTSGMSDAGVGNEFGVGVGAGFGGVGPVGVQDAWPQVCFVSLYIFIYFRTFTDHYTCRLQEFSTFNFAPSTPSATSPIKSSPLSPLSNIASTVECYSPFQQTPPPNSSSQDVVDPSMPMLVERPYDPLDHQLDHHQPMGQVHLQSSHLQHNQAHLAAPIPHHALQIQTTNLPSWSTPSAPASEYSHTHSPHDPYSTHHFGGGAYDPSPQQQQQALTPYASSVSDYDYSMGTGAGSPTSPSTASQAHTPREGSADICASSFPGAHTTSGAAHGYGGFHEFYAPEESKMLVQQQQQQGVGMHGQGQGGHGGMQGMIDMEALNGALAPFM